MDYNKIRHSYLCLHPPVYEGKDEYAYIFSNADLQIIKNSTEPVNDKENRKERLKLLLYIRKNYPHDGKAYKWANEMIWNECCGFVKLMIARYKEPGITYYNDLVNECGKAIYDNIDSYNPEQATLTTFFTLHLVHAISDFITREINRNSAYYSKNVRKVEKAIEYFRANGKQTVTKTDIALYTKLNIHKVEDALTNIQAKNAISIDDEIVINSISNSSDPADAALKSERSEIISNALETLDEQDREIVRLYYDLDDHIGKPMTIAGVAKALNTTSDKVEKSLRKSLRKLRKDRNLKNYCSPAIHEVKKDRLVNNSQKIDEFFEDFMDEFVSCDMLDYNNGQSEDDVSPKTDDKIRW